MPQCEQCQRDFTTDEGLAQHNRDKHGIGKVTAHEMKEQKRHEREQVKEKERSSQKRTKRTKQAAIAAVVLLILAGIGYFVANLPKQAEPAGSYDLTGFPSSFIHWHADVDVVICGEDRRVPEAVSGGLLGKNRLHTHDRSTNINSLPGSDGNGVIHTEGNVRQAPSEHTLERFMQNIGVKFSESEIMDKKNGDTCGNATGTVKVSLNDQPLSNFTVYLPRDKDNIRIEFS